MVMRKRFSHLGNWNKILLKQQTHEGKTKRT